MNIFNTRFVNVMIIDIFFRAKRKVFFWKNIIGQKTSLCSPNKLSISKSMTETPKSRFYWFRDSNHTMHFKFTYVWYLYLMIWIYGGKIASFRPIYFLREILGKSKTVSCRINHTNISWGKLAVFSAHKYSQTWQ